MVQLVYDPEDSRECMRRLAELHSLANGCVVCRPPPGPGTRGVSAALLRGLGKQLRLAETPHDPHRQLQHAAIWLAAEEIADLVVVRADRLAPAAWTMLLDLARRVPYLTLSLVIHRPTLPMALRATLGDEPHDELHYQGLDAPPAEPTQVPPHGEPAFPAVPDIDFPLFLSACEELLDRADADRVLASHAAEHARTRAWLHQQRRPGASVIAGRLGALVGACGDPHETLARLRGAQSALFLAGWLAAFDTGAVFAGHAIAHGSPLDDAAIALLRGYTSTQRAALGVIALASRAPADTIARLTVADVDRRTGSIRIANRQHALAGAAAGIVRAHRLARVRSNGATGDRLAVHRPPRSGSATEAHRSSTPAARTHPRNRTDLHVRRSRPRRGDRRARPRPAPMALLNRRLIASRRAALGLSRHDLAQASGLATSAIEHIETNGTHDHLQLTAAIQLAGALGIPIADLLQPTAPKATVGRGDIAVEALLAEQRRPLSAEDIARILDWTLRQTLAALRALERRLDGTGQALQRLPIHQYALVPAATALTRRSAATPAAASWTGSTSPPHKCCTASFAGHGKTADGTPTATTSARTWRSSSASGSSTTPADNSNSAPI